VIGGGPHFWAAPYERGSEFGGRGLPAAVPQQDLAFKTKGQPGENTTLVVVATDAALTKAQARRVAIMAQDGMARALRPVHTPLDGDIVFVGATGVRPLTDKIFSVSELGSLAADVVARAIGRGVFEAKAPSFPGALPSWHDRFTAR
jgi:L-aminopeptidase/D-esterase-like protein